MVDRRGKETAARRRAEGDTNEIRRSLAVLEREIEEHRRWLREDPVLRRHTGKAA